jgi:hypothetical protein
MWEIPTLCGIFQQTGRRRRSNAHVSPNHKEEGFLMARYSRGEIEALCKRLETRARSVVFKDQPELVSDLKAASLLLMLMLALSEIESLETDAVSTH